MELGGRAIAAALERAGADPGAVKHVVMGHVLQAGQGQITARQAAARGGVPMTVPALTVNKVCLSGLNAIATAAQYVELGLAGLLIAGGMESMSGAPYLVPKARFGARMGDAELVDAMVHDGLWDAFDDAHMGGLSDQVNQRLGIDRADQDEWSARSHERAAERPRTASSARRSPRWCWPSARARSPSTRTRASGRHHRPGPRPAPAAFSPDGTITAGNAYQISDGAAAVVVTSRERAAAEGLGVLATVVAYGSVAGPDTSLHSQPSRAIADACHRAGVAPGDLDLVELNEAFAAVALRSTQELGLDKAIVNVNGGAVALGHPIGASAPGWCSPWPWSCAAAAAGSARPPCAAAGARAMPCWSGSRLDASGAARQAADRRQAGRGPADLLGRGR